MNVLESSEKSIFSSLVRKQITGKFGKNMKDTMKGLGINTAFIYDKLLGSGLFEYYMVKGNEMILQLVYDMTSEENPQYSDYMYLEDNNTTLRLD